jgi:riboflavin synthase
VFTGIIEEVGTVRGVERLNGGRAFRIAAAQVLDGLKPGDSVAIDGACHTVTEIDRDGFSVQSVATTLQRTILGGYASGRRVNLERAIAFGQRLGGHLLQGHVDGVGRVLSIAPRSEHVLIDFTLPPIVEEVTILHGSIAVNGISLTVNALPEPGVAQISIVPHTWSATALPDLEMDMEINLEGDLIGKYVRHLIRR